MASSLVTMRSQLLSWFLLVGFYWLVYCRWFYWPLVLLAVGLQWHLEQSLISDKQAQLYAMAREKGHLVRERVSSVKGQAEQAATLPSITRLLTDATNRAQIAMAAEFSQRFTLLNGHYDLLLVDTSGKVVFTLMNESDYGAQLTSTQWRKTPSGIAFEQAKSTMTTIITPYRWYEPSQRRAAFVATPVWDVFGKWVGVLIVQLNESWLDSITDSQIGLSATGEVVLAQHNSEGKLVAAAPLRFHPKAHLEGFLLDGHHDIPANRAIRGEEGWSDGIDYRGKPVLAGWVNIPALEMALVVKQDIDEILQPMIAQRYVIAIAVVALLIFIAWIMTWVTRYFVKPIHEIAHAAEALALGRWYVRVPQGQARNQELYYLEQGMNQLAETIEYQFDRLQQQATELEEQASELNNYSHDLEALVAERTKELELLSVVDPMTSLFNRRHYMSEAPKLWRQAARNRQMLLFVLLDVDKFKEYNDTQGHKAGDEALVRIAQVLQESCQRSNDIVLRMGGEEMAVLSLIKTEQEAIAIAERILMSVEMCAIPHPASSVLPILTVSLGMAIFDGEFCHAPTETNVDKLYALADAALYQAKSTGRNRAVLAQEKVTC